jgi:hypothetical protein
MGQFSLSPRRLTLACVAICRRHVNTDPGVASNGLRSKYILRLTTMTAGRPVIGACSRPFPGAYPGAASDFWSAGRRTSSFDEDA